MDRLPADIVRYVLIKYLSLQDIIRFSLTSRRMYNWICNENEAFGNQLWRSMFMHYLSDKRIPTSCLSEFKCLRRYSQTLYPVKYDAMCNIACQNGFEKYLYHGIKCGLYGSVIILTIHAEATQRGYDDIVDYLEKLLQFGSLKLILH